MEREKGQPQGEATTRRQGERDQGSLKERPLRGGRERETRAASRRGHYEEAGRERPGQPQGEATTRRQGERDQGSLKERPQ
ncbi:hypothetical protein NHX12_011892 [Muraenolepis orangiensis]|uniref:Uncharacterized protein n=1 Tax=Muraenolepis orangiensis TaxID=630683 RepID=A0A9Q0DH53_9TELE|nr:hypothetical protein NHX12_011892 [Muraenolepis orangiensis]